MRLTILGPNVGTGGEFHVHAEGCRDLKGKQYAATIYHGEYDSGEYVDRRSVVVDVYPPDQFGYDDADWAEYGETVQFFPCTSDLPNEQRCAMPECENPGTIALAFVDAPDGQIDLFCSEHADEAKLSGLWDAVEVQA